MILYTILLLMIISLIITISLYYRKYGHILPTRTKEDFTTKVVEYIRKHGTGKIVESYERTASNYVINLENEHDISEDAGDSGIIETFVQQPNGKILVFKIKKEYFNSSEAERVMTRVHLKTKKFIDYLVKKYPNNENIKLLNQRYNPNKIEEVCPRNGDNNTSYVVNKGSEIGYCIRERDTPDKFVDQNVLFYVIIHELSHLASKSYGHGPEFRKNFILLLDEARKAGIYNEIDYSKTPHKYCGITINEMPPNIAYRKYGVIPDYN